MKIYIIYFRIRNNLFQIIYYMKLKLKLWSYYIIHILLYVDLYELCHNGGPLININTLCCQAS